MATVTRYKPSGENALFDDAAGGIAFANAQGYTLAANPIAAPSAPVKTKLTRQAFKSRFPKLANGVTTKYSATELFLNNDAYAASLTTPVSGAALIALRLLIVEGTTSMGLSGYVDLALPDAANFTGLLAQPSIPVEFRLTAAERTAILTAPILASEEYKGV